MLLPHRERWRGHVNALIRGSTTVDAVHFGGPMNGGTVSPRRRPATAAPAKFNLGFLLAARPPGEKSVRYE